MKLEFTCDHLGYQDFLADVGLVIHYRTQSNALFFIYFLLSWLPVLSVLVLIFQLDYSFSSSTLFLVSVLLLAVCFPMSFYFNRTLSRRYQYAFMDNIREQLNHFVVEADESGIRAISESGESVIYWHAIKEIYAADKHFIVINEFQTVFIPHKALTANDISSLNAFADQLHSLSQRPIVNVTHVA